MLVHRLPLWRSNHFVRAVRRRDPEAAVTSAATIYMPLRGDDGLRSRLLATHPMLTEVAERLRDAANAGHVGIIYHWRQPARPAPGKHDGVWRPTLRLTVRYAASRELAERHGPRAVSRYAEVAAHVPLGKADDLTYYIVAVIEDLAAIHVMAH